MKRIKLKNKKKFNFKIIKFLLFIIIVIISMAYTIKYFFNKNHDITKEAYLNYLSNKTSNKLLKKKMKKYMKIL